MQGNQPQLGAKDQLALQFMENPEELRNYLGIGGEFAPVPFADGVGGYFYNKATGDFKLIGDENTYNINDERGMTMLNEAKNRALAMSDANLKRAEKSEQSRSAWETLVGFMGPEAASLLGSKPADQQRIMELALANVYAMQQIPMPEDVDVEMAWQTIMNDPGITDAERQQIAEMVRRSVGQ